MQNFMSKGKRWIGKLFGVDPRGRDPDRPAGSPPAQRGAPAAPGPVTIPAPSEPTISGPPSFAPGAVGSEIVGVV